MSGYRFLQKLKLEWVPRNLLWKSKILEFLIIVPFVCWIESAWFYRLFMKNSGLTFWQYSRHLTLSQSCAISSQRTNCTNLRQRELTHMTLSGTDGLKKFTGARWIIVYLREWKSRLTSDITRTRRVSKFWTRWNDASTYQRKCSRKSTTSRSPSSVSNLVPNWAK